MIPEKQITIELRDNEWPFNGVSHDRVIARAVVFDDSHNLYFVHVDRDDDFGKCCYLETSGGGVEENETLEKAIKRELKEELGVEAEVITKLGIVSDYYNLIKRHNINHFFLCKIKSFCDKHLTQDEINCYHLMTAIVSPNKALEIYENQDKTKVERLVRQRELPMIKKAIEIIDKMQ